MKRTQIYFTAEQLRDLQIRGRKEHKTMAELVRRAVDQTYRRKARSNFKEALDNVAGIWAERRDIPSTEEYVRSVRKSRRLERFGLDK